MYCTCINAVQECTTIKGILSNVHFLQVVEHKQNAILEEKRRKAMDMHLNFIVDQTQKYSSWLMKGMETTPTDPSLTSTASRDGKLTLAFQ